MLALVAGLCGSTLSMQAQNTSEVLEYKMEFGALAGPCFYLGDANSVPFAHMSMCGGLLARHIFNPRMALKGNLAFGHISGNTDGIFIPTDPNSQTPEGGIPTRVRFSRNVLDIGCQFEMNFWAFGMDGTFKGHSRLTPYAVAGVGFTLGMGGGASTCGALNIPVGAGLKFKLAPRINTGFEWTVRFTTSDHLDATAKGTQLAYPLGIHSKGFKNKDAYSMAVFYLTYDLRPKYRKCNN